ncbi:DNA gyrase subunit A [Candidatus Woesearchaeota archaeon]|nr:DNA gyrase subunit A [Candidatus Woesearchaeota archaeon]
MEEGNNKPENKEVIIPRLIEEEMKASYIEYALSVIVARALPDVRDGLKPVHRRVLFAMHDLGNTHTKPHKKSARIVGEVIGKYHPHGDTAVYDTMVRMAQNFSLRYTLVDGQGNWGSIDGDSAAAMRYTEARLTKIAEELLLDLDKETVDFQPNFDASLQEPLVLPAKLPNLLLNGSSGIAVGMATNIPPHNLREVIDGIVHYINNPACEPLALLQFINGPDFPTGGIIVGRGGIREAYATGRGKITVRARIEVEEKAGKKQLIVNEIPYQVNKTQLIEQIVELTKEKTIQGIADMRDESDREGMRIVIILKKDADPHVVMNQLYKQSRLQSTFGVNTLALVGKEPRTLTLKELIEQYVLHRRIVVRRRTVFELAKAEKRAHLLEGLVIALQNIDEVIRVIKASESADDAKKHLLSSFPLTEEQALAILDMKLQKLTSLETTKIKEELDGLRKLITELRSILASEQRILDIIKQELLELREQYGDGRKTEIIDSEEDEIETAELVKQEDVAVTVTHNGYIKRQALVTYKQQRRGGRGIVAATTGEEDVVEHLYIANTHSSLLFFTNQGQVHWLKAYILPEASRISKGKAIVNLLPLDQGEKINAIIPISTFDEKHFLMFATKQGTVKKTPLSEFSNPRRGGIRAITLDEGDSLVNVVLTDGTRHIIIATKQGAAIRFDEQDVRPIGRVGRGVRGISLEEHDEVIEMVVADETKELLTVTEHGYGKRTPVNEYRLTGRGGKGVINMKTADRNGTIVAVKAVTPQDECMIISQKGVMIRTKVGEIASIGRNTLGVRVMKLAADDKVKAAACIVGEAT